MFHVPPCSQYFESTLVPRLCEPELSLVESRIRATAEFFGASCKAGPWVPDQAQDRLLSMLENVFSNTGTFRLISIFVNFIQNDDIHHFANYVTIHKHAQKVISIGVDEAPCTA